MNYLIRRFMVVFTILFASVSIFQANVSKAAVNGGYAIKPVESNDANVNIDGGYYVVKANAGDEVSLSVEINNSEKENRQFLIQGNTSYTGDDGTPAYNKQKVKDPNLKTNMRDLFEKNDFVVDVAGGSSSVVNVKLRVPAQKFPGYIMGGLVISPYHEAAKGSVTQNGTLIKNKFSYSLPIQMKLKESKVIDPNYQVNRVIPKINTVGDAKQLIMLAEVANTKNAFVANLDSKAVITKYGDKSFKKVKEQPGQSIVPTSHYNYDVNWGKDKLQAGKYHIKITYSAQSVRTWVVDKDFTITDAQANKYNRLAGYKPNYMWLYIILAVLVLALILGLGLYLGKRGQKNNNNNGNAPMRSKSRRRRRR